VSGDGVLRAMDTLTDEDFKRTVWSALRLMAVVVAVAVPLVWWKMGWQSAAFLLVGALISGSGLFEWLRLMTDGWWGKGAAAGSGAGWILPATGADRSGALC
jgi:hypothetical protein